MRRTLPWLLLGLALLSNNSIITSAWSADKDLAEVPEPPGLPQNYRTKDAERPEDLEPEITITPKPDAIHEEYRINGRLYMIKVKPKNGRPYYLIDREGSGEFARSDLEPKIAIPMWVLKRF